MLFKGPIFIPYVRMKLLTKYKSIILLVFYGNFSVFIFDKNIFR